MGLAELIEIFFFRNDYICSMPCIVGLHSSLLLKTGTWHSVVKGITSEKLTMSSCKARIETACHHHQMPCQLDGKPADISVTEKTGEM